MRRSGRDKRVPGESTTPRGYCCWAKGPQGRRTHSSKTQELLLCLRGTRLRGDAATMITRFLMTSRPGLQPAADLGVWPEGTHRRAGMHEHLSDSA